MNNTYINFNLYELNVDITYVYISTHRVVGGNKDKSVINWQIGEELLILNHD